MSKSKHMQDARVLVAIHCPAAYICIGEKGYFQDPS